MELEKERKTIQTNEIRVLPVALEVRAAEGENGKRTITGSIKYNSESQVMRDIWGDEFIEEFAPGAFADHLRSEPTVFLWSHQMDQVLANTKSGTLRLFDGQTELRFEADVANTTAGNDAFELVQRGDVDGVSFGFAKRKDAWSRVEKDGKRIYKRTILNASLPEISPVAFPAYPGNDVSVRSLEEFKKEEQRAADQYEKEKLSIELDLFG
jgi:HK97 family phage prohead protease